MAGSELLALRAPDGATVTLERYPIVIGRSLPGGTVPDVDVGHLDRAQAVSNRHCELLPAADGAEVRDLGEPGGTWVDGRRLPPGGRALLRLGGDLQLAGVTLVLVPAPGARPAPSDPSGRDQGSGGWPDSQVSAIPPPPSLYQVPAPAPPQAPEPATPEADLGAAPPLARAELERGAEAVRLRPELALQVRRDGVWSDHGDPLSGQAVEAEAAAVRSALGLGKAALSGFGYRGDVELEFILPPLSRTATVAVLLAPQEQVPPGSLEPLLAALRAGGAVLIAAPRPEAGLRSLAQSLSASAARPRVLSYGDPSAWAPPGWPILEPGSPHAQELAGEADPLLLERPPGDVLGALLARMPRLLGGTVVALAAASPQAALEECARVGEAPNQASPDPASRLRTARLFQWVLGWSRDHWQVFEVTLEAVDGDWGVRPLGVGSGDS